MKMTHSIWSSQTQSLKGYDSDIVDMLEQKLAKEIADQIDKEIMQTLGVKPHSKEIIERTVSRIKQTIRENRLGKILRKKND